MSLRARNEAHLIRRIWHFCGVMAMFAFYCFVSQKQALTTALVVSSVMISLDVVRLYIPKFNRFFIWLFRRIIRDSETHRISGISFMLVGVTLIVFAFPKNVVLLTLLFVALADPMASEIGIRFGKDKLIGQKSLQGSLAAFCTCFVLALGFFIYFDLMRERLFIVSLLAGIIGAFSELVPIGKLDDNFVFPVLSAILLTGLMIIFGGL